MKALEDFFKKVEKETKLSSLDISDIIPSDTLDILTKDDSSSGKQLLHILFSDYVTIFNKLDHFSKWLVHNLIITFIKH